MPRRSLSGPRSWWAERHRVLMSGVEGPPGERKVGVGGVGPGTGEHPKVEPYQFVEEPEAEEVPLQVSCPRCGGATRTDTVRTDIWQGDGLIVVEDIPALVCDRCVEQFYSEPVTDALRRLVQEGLDSAEPKREMVVRVYSLAGRVKVPRPPPGTSYRSRVPPEGA